MRVVIPVNPEYINATSVKLFSGLRFTAVDCLYPNERENFEVTEWFFLRSDTQLVDRRFAAYDPCCF